MKRTKVVEHLREIWGKIYNYEPDMMNDDPLTMRVKQVINNSAKISKNDRALFLIYTEAGSLQNVVKLLQPDIRVSKSTLRNEIARIKSLIIQSL